MPRLPQPSTTSPGFLELVYGNGTLTHKIRQRIITGVDPTDHAVMAPEALTWATHLGAVIFSNQTITGYRVLNASGVELYTGVFGTPIVGALNPSGLTEAQSFTKDYVGRGNPGGGLAQGNTRHMWFPGYWFNTNTGVSYVPIGGSDDALFITYLNGSTVIGADKYGTKAVYQNKVDLQFNAHYQKRFGM